LTILIVIIKHGKIGDYMEETLKKEIYQTWFNATYQSKVCSELHNRWKKFDVYVQGGIALTASGSAVASINFFQDAEGRTIWALICALIAIVAILHQVINVTNKVAIWGEGFKTYKIIKNQLELLKTDLNLNEQSELVNFTKRLKEINDLYAKEDPQIPEKDFFLTKVLENRVLKDVLEPKQQTPFIIEIGEYYEKYKNKINK